jgi:hypothetical protein
MSVESGQKRRPGQPEAAQKDNIFVIAPLETPAQGLTLGKKEAAAAEKDRLEKSRKRSVAPSRMRLRNRADAEPDADAGVRFGTMKVLERKVLERMER